MSYAPCSATYATLSASLLAASTVLGCGAGAADSSTFERPSPLEVLRAEVQSRDTKADVAGGDLTSLVDGNTELAFQMLTLLSQANPNDNLALGPYSISHALAMLYAGARGDTEEEMSEALHFDPDQDSFHNVVNGLDLELLSRNPDVLLRNANQAWVASGFDPEPDYLDILTRYYGAPMAVVDFAGDSENARAEINEWVSEVTEGKIPELFPAGTIQSNTVLALTNAMYLDAPWKYPFNPDHTSAREFSLRGGTTAQVDMMHYNEFLPSAWDEDWQAVEIPYRGDELSMIVVVPEDLEDFEQHLDPAAFDEIVGAIRDGGIHLSMPKFSFSFHTALEPVLRELGLGSLFDGPDLSGIGSGDLALQSAEHEAFVEVDEEGTRAAAATGLAVADSHGPTVDVDRPFYFFVLDRSTRTVLFLGRVLDPRG